MTVTVHVMVFSTGKGQHGTPHTHAHSYAFSHTGTLLHAHPLTQNYDPSYTYIMRHTLADSQTPYTYLNQLLELATILPTPMEHIQTPAITAV